LASSKIAPINAPYCADCRGKDDRDCRNCRNCNNNPLQPREIPAGKGGATGYVDKTGQYHYRYEGD